MSLQNIPVELRQLNQWVAAGADKQPLNPRTGRLADVTDPTTWGTYAEALACGYKFVGFVLSKDDPFTIIDLDDPAKDSKGEYETDADVVEARTRRHAKIFAHFESYAEVSQSGAGVHIIVRGSVPRGVRRDRVEVYSDSRYMICTGNALNSLPVTDQQEGLDLLFAEMAKDDRRTELVEVGETLTDAQVLEMANNASNGERFRTLWEGRWQGNPAWPSQSEADFALLAMLAFYSKSNEQCRRLFRASGLMRDKAKRDAYLNFALEKQRAKDLPQIDLSAILTAKPSPAPTLPPPPAKRKLPRPPVVAKVAPRMDNPPGFIGDLSRYIYESAVLPVHEVALAAALALTAGVVGRSYNISGTGLNQYIIVLANTGTGKESAGKGINAMINAVMSTCPTARDFIGPSAFASGQGLVRTLAKPNRQCFVSVLGEFGMTLQQICDPKASSAERMLKRVLLDIYNKSGFNDMLYGTAYSDSEKDVVSVQSPNVTILGESTPETFYKGLDSAGIAEGLIPRFTVLQYDGPRPDRNPKAFSTPPDSLVNEFSELIATSVRTAQARQFIPVTLSADALALMDGFDRRATAQINAHGEGPHRQLWNRAHLKALKLAGLVAVGCNPHQPCVDVAAANWAIEVVTLDIEKMLAKFEAGDVGTGDSKLESHVRKAVRDYLNMTETQRRKYGVSEKMIQLQVIPWQFLRRRLKSCADFKNDRRGENAAINATLAFLSEADEVVRIPAADAKKYCDTNAPLYVQGASFQG